jgi:cytochrome d ubiquinol oxidase subunit I
MLVVGFDRALTGFSLFIHIILASIGIALPVIILSLEFLGIRKNDRDYEVMAKRLAIVFVILFAIGTASGILIALELLFIWPNFMALVSQVAILPFYIEVFAFFIETIFLGIYIYSWDKFKSKYMHLLSGIPIAIGAALSGILISMINAFMNTPTGFNIPAFLNNGTITNVMPFAVFTGPSTAIEYTHVLFTSYLAGALIFLSYFAFMLLKTKDEKKIAYYKKGLKVAIVIGIIATVFSVYTGLVSISSLLTLQPEKYAAIEGNIYPQSYAPERLGGIPVNGTLEYYIPIPDLQSILATGSLSGMVPGLSSYPKSTWPPLIVHLMFDMLLGSSFLIGFIFFIFVVLFLLKKKPLEKKIILYSLVLLGFLAVFALEDGWVMSELARQPWIIYNVMLVSAAANYSSGISPVTVIIMIFYIVAIPVAVLLIRKVFRNRPLENELA